MKILLFFLHLLSDIAPVALLVLEPTPEVLLRSRAVRHVKLWLLLSNWGSLDGTGLDSSPSSSDVLDVCSLEEEFEFLLLVGLVLLLYLVTKPVRVLDGGYRIQAVLLSRRDHDNLEDVAC